MATLRRQQQNPAGTQIQISPTERFLIVRCEPINDVQGALIAAEFERRITVILIEAVLKSTISSHHVHIPFRIHGRPGPGHPNTARTAIGRGAKHHFLLQRFCVIAKYPTVVRRKITEGSRSHVHDAIVQQQRRPLMLTHGVVWQHSISTCPVS